SYASLWTAGHDGLPACIRRLALRHGRRYGRAPAWGGRSTRCGFGQLVRRGSEADPAQLFAIVASSTWLRFFASVDTAQRRSRIRRRSRACGSRVAGVGRTPASTEVAEDIRDFQNRTLNTTGTLRGSRTNVRWRASSAEPNRARGQSCRCSADRGRRRVSSELCHISTHLPNSLRHTFPSPPPLPPPTR